MNNRLAELVRFVHHSQHEGNEEDGCRRVQVLFVTARDNAHFQREFLYHGVEKVEVC